MALAGLVSHDHHSLRENGGLLEAALVSVYTQEVYKEPRESSVPGSTFSRSCANTCWCSSVVLLWHCRGTVSPLSKLAVKGHLDFVLVPGPLVKGVAAVKGRAVQMQADSSLCVADVLHTVQANGVINIGALIFSQNSLRFLSHFTIPFFLRPFKQRLL